MNLNTAVAFILGLVFQLAQVSAGAAVTISCPPHPTSCECCNAGKSCHCAHNGESDQKPAPAPIDTAGLLKITAARSTETHVSADPLHETEPSGSIAGFPKITASGGYTGVSLSVAFCTFVI